MTKNYKHNKAWRIRHPDRRYAQKARYYRKHNINKSRSGHNWTRHEMVAITDSGRPGDVELSRLLSRSVEAIQVKRSKLR